MSEDLVVGLLLVVGLAVVVAVWVSGARLGHRADRVFREASRGGGTAGRSVVVAAVIVGAQWVLLVPAGDPMVVALVLGVPALLAGVLVAWLCAVTRVLRSPRGGRRR